ncbi:Large ribosomal RNA subunit accumulation protein YCED2, chloroplastic [Sesamum angolense]|uniref:Large ribosomal RNA subunit accumulation protein YCED2, chloroplastic n=1 Tax=Sesamum angolense TaxID=2727404 RepID=A0AAE2BWH0_9LAMI|nr:Large ribosomal RNA subunit accumulation protein YCED2, chloroplastic [Sesamum angolense]
MINRFTSVQHKLMYLPISLPRASAAAKRNQLPPWAGKKKSKARLITISPSDGRWHGKWNSDYTFSIQELQLHDLPDDVQKDTDVSVALSIQKHAGLGLSVEGKITTCFTRKCCNCCTPYLREINTTFKVWILPSTRQIREYSSNHHHQLPDIGADDPSVIYVKPGYEANLDPLIQDNIRLATSVEETCSESCNNSQPKLHHLGARNRASIERRWHKLLELKKNNL